VHVVETEFIRLERSYWRPSASRPIGYHSCGSWRCPGRCRYPMNRSSSCQPVRKLCAARARGSSKRRVEWTGNYAACRRVISASAANPSAVNEYGELCAGLLFFTKSLRLRYCMRAFIDWGGKLNAFVTSLIRNSPESKITESTLRMRSDSTGRRSAWARLAD
jgi:hypothetical protein